MQTGIAERIGNRCELSAGAEDARELIMCTSGEQPRDHVGGLTVLFRQPAAVGVRRHRRACVAEALDDGLDRHTVGDLGRVGIEPTTSGL